MFDEIRIVRVCACACAQDGSRGIMRVCATWPSDSSSPRKRVGGSAAARPHMMEENGRTAGYSVVRFCGSCDLRVNARTMV